MLLLKFKVWTLVSDVRSHWRNVHLILKDFGLSDYNTVKEFYGNPDLVNMTTESDALFERIQKSKALQISCH